MSRSIYFVTYGKEDGGANPGLTPLGRYQVKQLREHLPKKPRTILAGTGRKHHDTAEALELEPTRYSFIFGGPETEDQFADTVILADGNRVKKEQYTSATDRAGLFIKNIKSLPGLAVVITSCSMVSLLMEPGQAKPAAVYWYVPQDGRLIELFAAPADLGGGEKI
ncbi:MAG: hypothetical protein WCX71_03060 [Candidatus Buchananbacteria bacterium]